MVQRSMTRTEALRAALAELQAGGFARARDLAAPFLASPDACLLHALGRAGAGDVAGAAPTLAGIAKANPGARHPVLDLADLLSRQGRQSDAIGHLRAALEHRPQDAPVLARLGSVLAEAGPMEEAVASFQTLAARVPNDAGAWSNLGKVLAATGAFEAAEAAFAQSGRLAPQAAQLRLNHGIARLKSGQWDPQAWALFRARHALAGHPPSLPGPELAGLEGVAGKTVLLVHSEGFGDTIQFIRYAPLLAGLGARVLMWAPAPLRRLLRGFPGLSLVEDDVRYDAWLRLPDLPGVFGTTLGSIPAGIPYLHAEPSLAAAWAAKLPAGRKVGLVWAGAARVQDPGAVVTDRQRSIAAQRMAPLLGLTGVRWISLQLGHAPLAGVFDPMPRVTDFADTAAIIANLDCVVSVDTALAHLAAAMGKRVILLDRYDHCWRWSYGMATTPWYPEVMRILRQPAPGDWESVLRQACAVLAETLALSGGAQPDPDGLHRLGHVVDTQDAGAAGQGD